MSHERDLSRSIILQTEKFLSCFRTYTDAPLLVDGVAIDYPYSEVGRSSYDNRVSETSWKSYQAMSRLFNPKTMPRTWISFIKEVDIERKANGCSSPVDLVIGLCALTEECSDAVSADLPKFGRLDSGDINLQDGKMIAQMIDTVMDNPMLRAELKIILANLMPDEGSSRLDESAVVKVLNNAGITSGILLDLGCGIGGSTQRWSEKLSSFTILGVERQYHSQWYDPFWKEGRKTHRNLGFVRGDFAKGLPFSDNCADVAMFQFVAQHITQESLAKGLKEALGVLKNSGFLFVGPQYTKDCVGWRIFRKEALGDGQEYYFKEYKYYDLVPEDKPKPFRRKPTDKPALTS